MQVLIVDDESDIRDSLQEFLAEQGYQVETAANGADALALMHHNVPCVVILDLIMPQLDGAELYARMQTDPRLACVPVIISTSDPSRAPRGVPVMRKPIDLQRLLDTVRHHCAQQMA